MHLAYIYIYIYFKDVSLSLNSFHCFQYDYVCLEIFDLIAISGIVRMTFAITITLMLQVSVPVLYHEFLINDATN